MTKIDLDPWRIICSFFSRLRSYDVPDIIDRTGLSADWRLTEKQDHSHATRWCVYRARIDAAYDALQNEEDRLRVVFIAARELAKLGLSGEMDTALHEIGWGFQGERLVPTGANVRQLFFPEQKQHEAYVEIRAVIQRASQSLVVVDPYLDQSILTMLSTCQTGDFMVRLLTSKHPPDLFIEASKWRAQHPNAKLAIRKTLVFHDRFIIVDNVECWHVGCSIKDAGTKAFMLSQVEDEYNRSSLLGQIEKAWQSAIEVEI